MIDEYLSHSINSHLLLKTPFKIRFLLDEKQIIKGCQKGHKASQYELVKRYSQMLMTVCRRYTPDESLAKDILQESLIRIFKNIDSYQHRGSFEAWMRKITVNCALHWLRKTYLERETQVAEFQTQEAIQPEIWDKLDTEDIIALIQQLPDGFRTVFNLYFIEGYSHKEIAELLQITESTSRSQLTRARSILQKKINSNRFNKYRSA